MAAGRIAYEAIVVDGGSTDDTSGLAVKCFEKPGVLRRSLLEAFLMVRYLLGASPRKLLQAHVRPSPPGPASPA